MNNLTNLRLIEKFTSKSKLFTEQISKIGMTDDYIDIYVNFDRKLNAYFNNSKKWNVKTDDSGFINCRRYIGGIRIEITLW